MTSSNHRLFKENTQECGTGWLGRWHRATRWTSPFPDGGEGLTRHGQLLWALMRLSVYMHMQYTMYILALRALVLDA